MKRAKTDKDRERDRARYQQLKKDPEFKIKEQERNKQFYQDNKEKVDAKNREWARRNAARVKEISRTFEAKNGLKRRECKQRGRGTYGKSVRHDIFWLTAEFANGRISFDEYNRRIRGMYVRLNGRLEGQESDSR